MDCRIFAAFLSPRHNAPLVCHASCAGRAHIGSMNRKKGGVMGGRPLEEGSRPMINGLHAQLARPAPEPLPKQSAGGMSARGVLRPTGKNHKKVVP